MKNNITDDTITMIDSRYAPDMPEGTIDRIRERTLKQATSRLRSRHSVKRTLLIAATIATLTIVLTVSAFAFSEELRDFVFGNSAAKLVEFNEREHTAKVVSELGEHTLIFGSSYRLMDRSVSHHFVPFSGHNVLTSWDDLVADYLEVFLSFEELSSVAPFTLKEPAFLPDGIKLNKALIYLFEDKTYSYDTFIEYVCADGQKLITFHQFFVGPDAYYDVEVVDNLNIGTFQSVSSIETIILNNTEALLGITSSISSHEGSTITSESINITWIQDEIGYGIHSYDFDLETMLAIANSIK